MPWYDLIWTDENEEHILEHGVTKEEVEYVIRSPHSCVLRRDSRRTRIVGWTQSGRELVVAYEEVDDMTVYPVTPFEPEAQ